MTRRAVKPLAVYVRVSRQGKRDEAEFLSPELQERKIRDYAAGKAVAVTDEVFADIDVSGGKMDRKQLNRVLAGIRDGEYGGVIVARLDRFARSAQGGLRVMRQIHRAGGILVAPDSPVDLTTSMGKAMMTVMLAFFEYYIDAAREQSDELHDGKIREGVYLAAAAPAGYDFTETARTAEGKSVRGKLVPNEHAPAIEAAFRLRAGGGSWKEVAALLTEAGVPTSRGEERWGVRAASRLLENRAYLGEARWGGVTKTDDDGEAYTTAAHINEQAHAAIVGRALFNRVQATREQRDARGKAGGASLLAGILRCATCGGAMSLDHTRRNGGEPYPFYRCRGERCDARPTISAKRVEGEVEAAVRAALAEARVTRLKPSAETDGLLEGLAEAREEMALLKADIASGARRATAAVLDALQAVEARADTAQAAVDAAESAGLAAPVLRTAVAAYDALSVEGKRPIIRGVLEMVLDGAALAVKPGRGADRLVGLEGAS